MEPTTSLLLHYLEIGRPYLQHYGYAAVFVIVLVEGFGVPAPGQTLIIAGALLAARGELNIVGLVLVAWSAAVLGDNIGYAIGHYGGRRLVLRHGGHVGVRARHLEHVERFFVRFGGGIVAAARFFEVLRQLNGVVAGISGMPWWRFLVFNALGATLWISVWGYGVFRIGQDMDQALAWFKNAEPYVISVGLLGVVGLFVYLMRSESNGGASL